MNQEKPIRILYMEDDPGLGRLLQKRFRRMEYHVDVVPDGEQGMQRCAEVAYDIILADHHMPGLTGIEVIRALAKDKDHPPLIMLTGQGDEDLAVTALKSGASDYLVKDVNLDYLEHLPSAINATLANARLASEKKRIECELQESERFNRAILDSLTAHMAILDEHGSIIRVNTAWQRFAMENGIDRPGYGVGENYLALCDTSSGPNSDDAREIAARIRAVSNGKLPEYQQTYECSNGDTRRWFTMRVSRVGNMNPSRVVIAHEDVTDLKVTEETLRQLSQKDGLTGLANRRHFDETLEKEWARSARNRSSLSLLMLDIDHFKLYNDQYGHLMGDDAIRQVARALKEQLNRPTDLAARYGGEEFVVLLPDTTMNGALHIAEQIRATIETLAIPHVKSKVAPVLTVSIGASSIQAHASADPATLIHVADTALYHAKQNGRNTIAHG